jgi:hypothetical protein
VSNYVRIEGRVQGIDDVKRRLAERPAQVWTKLQVVMANSGKQLEGSIASKARGSMKAHSGKLFRSTYHRIVEKKGVITAYAGVRRRAYYGRFIEGGLKDQTVDVRSYSRRVRSSDVKAKTTDEVTGKTRRRTVAQGVGFVKAYKKRMHLTARPFVRPSYQALRGSIEAAIIAAVNG